MRIVLGAVGDADLVHGGGDAGAASEGELRAALQRAEAERERALAAARADSRRDVLFAKLS